MIMGMGWWVSGLEIRNHGNNYDNNNKNKINNTKNDK